MTELSDDNSLPLTTSELRRYLANGEEMETNAAALNQPKILKKDAYASLNSYLSAAAEDNKKDQEEEDEEESRHHHQQQHQQRPKKELHRSGRSSRGFY